jgi:hypothetical protein
VTTLAAATEAARPSVGSKTPARRKHTTSTLRHVALVVRPARSIIANSNPRSRGTDRRGGLTISATGTAASHATGGIGTTLSRRATLASAVGVDPIFGVSSVLKRLDKVRAPKE